MWGLFLLTEHQGIRKKVEEEATAIGGDLTFDSLKKLPYIERFIYEVLRLYPPVPSDLKCAVKDDTLPSGIKIYAGEMIMWSQNIMGRQETFFPNPTKVDPDRWLGASNNGGVEPVLWSKGFIPFQNGGRRTCLGQEMAMLEVKAFLVAFVRSGIHLSVAPEQKIIRYPNITLSAKNGIKFVVNRKPTE